MDSVWIVTLVDPITKADEVIHVASTEDKAEQWIEENTTDPKLFSYCEWYVDGEFLIPWGATHLFRR